MTQLTVDLFQQHLQENFIAKFNDHPDITLKLAEVETRLDTEAQTSFSLLFHGPKEPLLGQQTYLLNHDQLGELNFFLVPIAQNGEEAHYESIFSILKEGN